VPRLVEPVVHGQVLLAGELRSSVRGERLALLVLACRFLALAVDRPAGRAEHHLRAEFASSFEHPHRAEDVDVGVVVGARDRDPYVLLRGEMEADLRLGLREDRRRVSDVPLHESSPRGHVLAPAVREVVEDRHLVAARQQALRDV
jgi:hypothetical protein